MPRCPRAATRGALEGAIDAQLARVVREGVTEAELRRAKNLVAADFWRGVPTIDGKARLLGEYAVMHGDHRRCLRAPAAYERVTREDVQRDCAHGVRAAAAHGRRAAACR